MNWEFDENEQELSNLLVIRDADGHVAVMLGLVVMLFYEDPLRRSTREAVAAITDDYIHDVGSNLRWQFLPGRKKPSPLNAKTLVLPSSWLPTHPDNTTWDFQFHGGETGFTASAFMLEASGFFDPCPTLKNIGALAMTFPLLWFAGRGESMPEYVLRACRRLRPMSGYAGIGILERPVSWSNRRHFQAAVRTIAERFPGLSVEDRVGDMLAVRDGIKAVNWLNVLGDCWVREMGGVDELRARLGEPFIFYPYDGGLMIQAGPKPQLGDTEVNRWPQHYVTLAKVLKKIQIKGHTTFHYDRPGTLSCKETLDWLFRFDGK